MGSVAEQIWTPPHQVCKPSSVRLLSAFPAFFDLQLSNFRVYEFHVCSPCEEGFEPMICSGTQWYATVSCVKEPGNLTNLVVGVEIFAGLESQPIGRQALQECSVPLFTLLVSLHDAFPYYWCHVQTFLLMVAPPYSGQVILERHATLSETFAISHSYIKSRPVHAAVTW